VGRRDGIWIRAHFQCCIQVGRCDCIWIRAQLLSFTYKQYNHGPNFDFKVLSIRSSLHDLCVMYSYAAAAYHKTKTVMLQMATSRYHFMNTFYLYRLKVYMSGNSTRDDIELVFDKIISALQ
jgi:hypothetical protein